MGENNHMIKSFYVQITKLLLYTQEKDGFDLTVYPNTIGEIITGEEQFKFLTQANHTYDVQLISLNKNVKVEHKCLMPLKQKEIEHLYETITVLFKFRPMIYGNEHLAADPILPNTKLKITNFLDFPTGRFPVFVKDKKYHSIFYDTFITDGDFKDLLVGLNDASNFIT